MQNTHEYTRQIPHMNHDVILQMYFWTSDIPRCTEHTLHTLRTVLILRIFHILFQALFFVNTCKNLFFYSLEQLIKFSQWMRFFSDTTLKNSKMVFLDNKGQMVKTIHKQFHIIRLLIRRLERTIFII